MIIISKEFEIQGCVEVPMKLSEEEFWGKFIGFIEANEWSFGGGINEIIDGYYIKADSTKGKSVIADLPQNMYDGVINELFQHHSLAALIFLINNGRELEFSINDQKYFISHSGSSKVVSLWYRRK